MAFKIFNFALNVIVAFMLLGALVDSFLRIYWQIKNRKIKVR